MDHETLAEVNDRYDLHEYFLIVNILVFEYVTGGGWCDAPPPPALRAEADHIQTALLRNLLEIPGIAITAFRDTRWPVPAELADPIAWKPVEPTVGFRTQWLECLDHCDAVWPIAPESGGLLEGLCREVELAGKILLNCPARAVHLATSKRATLARLARHGIPVVPTRRFRGYRPVFPLIIKPDDGIGCQGIRIMDCEADWNEALCEINPLHYVIQPWLRGDSLSLSVLFEYGQAQLLSGNRQIIARRGNRLQLDAVEVNAFAPTPAHQALVTAVAQAIPELWGYAGIDLLQTQRGLQVLEINPRLTTASAGLQAALGINLARAVIGLVRQALTASDVARQRDHAVKICWPVA